MTQHWHVTVKEPGQDHALADWLVESEGDSLTDAALAKAAGYFNIAAPAPGRSLAFHKRLMNHRGEYPGEKRYDADGIKVWVFPKAGG
ncbi:MAG TPA: hypothetical protein VG796_28405 [Verrucomicrobiales bacterium]|jgi:hypothetical protein|nr:hypothetical protein [Verrucomicrobiales bacterium]